MSVFGGLLMIPTTELAKKIAALFRRRLTTPWDVREIRRYKKLVKAGAFDDPADFDLVSKYYETQRKLGENGRHRRDLDTFLNNWFGELDRARAWEEQMREKKKMGRKSFRGDSDEPKPINDEDFKKAGELARQQVKLLRAKFRGT